PDPRYDSSRNLPQRVSPQRPMRVSQRSRTVMYSLHSLEDCCEVIDQLIANNTVVLTMDELDGHLLQRAVDTLSGAVFALHASIRKASDRTYLVAPMSVEVNDIYDMDRRF
ncbi:MAG: cell division protein SepF, partial [Clostridia bacterium]|nr:cell division protein SepF [Clostridia bacterium]